MKHSKKEIAESFSLGNFKMTYPYLSENIVWKIIGENEFCGKSNVIQNCNQTTQYFESVKTIFKTDDIIESKNKVVIRGTGEFIRDGKGANLITACDVYEFNDNEELERITSYCIREKK